MSRYESVEKNIYGDPAFEALTLEAASVYLWSFINPLCNLAGLYKVSKERIAKESKVTAGRKLDKTLTELHAAGFMHFTDDGMLWCVSRVKYLPTKGPKIAQPIFVDVSRISPSHPLRVAFLFHHCVEHREHFDWLTALLDTLNVIPHTGEGGEIVGKKSYPEYDSSDDSSNESSISTSVWGSSVEQPTAKEKRALVGARISSLFEQWQGESGHTSSKLTTGSKRWKAAHDRLVIDKHEDDYLAQAITGICRYPFVVQGERKRVGLPEQRFDDFELALRADKIDRFHELGRAEGGTVTQLPVKKCVGPWKGEHCPDSADATAQGRCDRCYEAWSDRLDEGGAA